MPILLNIHYCESEEFYYPFMGITDTDWVRLKKSLPTVLANTLHYAYDTFEECFDAVKAIYGYLKIMNDA